jgi:hypothetical protein
MQTNIHPTGPSNRSSIGNFFWIFSHVIIQVFPGISRESNLVNPGCSSQGNFFFIFFYSFTLLNMQPTSELQKNVRTLDEEKNFKCNNNECKCHTDIDEDLDTQFSVEEILGRWPPTSKRSFPGGKPLIPMYLIRYSCYFVIRLI